MLHCCTLESLKSNLFKFTTGHFLPVSSALSLSNSVLSINQALSPPRAHTRLQHLRTPLNCGGLRELQDQGNSSFLKALEGWPERSFFIILGLGLRFVARIPYLTRIPKLYTLVSEVAAMEFLRSERLSRLCTSWTLENAA